VQIHTGKTKRHVDMRKWCRKKPGVLCVQQQCQYCMQPEDQHKHCNLDLFSFYSQNKWVSGIHNVKFGDPNYIGFWDIVWKTKKHWWKLPTWVTPVSMVITLICLRRSVTRSRHIRDDYSTKNIYCLCFKCPLANAIDTYAKQLEPQSTFLITVFWIWT